MSEQPKIIEEITTDFLAVDAASVELVFALAWKPVDTSIHVRALKAAARDVLPSTGALDEQSPFRFSLGKHERGKTVTVQWELRAYEDLQGIGVYILANTGAGAAWKLVDSKVPLAHLGFWSKSFDFKVP